ncbi:hypothetical protein [Paenisporosarcina sp. TG20]|uniref:hypothetical protein n=1 Tax=Paenisporosarcina sp. TG20 TaxID=1211706 RepID=UPI000319A77F|nr:hypothetical protein [Paenisporosarcina sp. TG20]
MSKQTKHGLENKIDDEKVRIARYRNEIELLSNDKNLLPDKRDSLVKAKEEQIIRPELRISEYELEWAELDTL